MLTANLTQQTNANFVQMFMLTPWADLYDLTQGGFRAQLRDVVSDPIALYEWSTANGNIGYSQTLANASITFTGNPSPNDIIMLGTTTVTFVASGATGLQVNVGGSLSVTLASLVTFLNASLDNQISRCTYSGTAGSILNITYDTAGTLGNAFPIAALSATAPVPPTLSGGGGLLTMTAPVRDIEEFNGTYYYDCRYENGPILTVLFGGTIQFIQGVTRDPTT